MELLDKRLSRENLINEGVASADDLSVNTYVNKNNQKMLIFLTFMSDGKMPEKIAANKANISHKTLNRFKLTSRKIIEYADIINADPYDSEYKNLIVLYEQYNSLVSDTNLWLYNKAKESLEDKIVDGIKVRGAATVRDIVYFGEAFGYIKKQTSVNDIINDSISDGSSIKINTVEIISNDDAKRIAEDSQKKMNDKTTELNNRLIENMKNAMLAKNQEDE